MINIKKAAIICLLLGLFLTSPTHKEDGIKWVTFEEAVKLQKKNKKKIYIDVYTNWCGWCKVMDRETFSNKYIIDYMNDKYNAVKLNGEYRQPITFKKREYVYVAQGRRGYHQLPATLMNGRLSYPTSILLDEKQNVLQVIPGYQKAPSMDKILNFFGEDHYKDIDWQTFVNSYDSPFN